MIYTMIRRQAIQTIAVLVLFGSGVLTSGLAVAQIPGSAADYRVKASESMPAILSMRARADLVDRHLEGRFAELLPGLMRRAGIDMWIVVAREYNEDPVIETMLPATWLAARRRTILVLFDRGVGEPIELMAVARYAVGSRFDAAWDPEAQPDQWAALAEIIRSRNPARIGLNLSETFALADGLTKTEHESMLEALDDSDRERLVSAEALAIGWLEARTEAEMAVYPQIVRIARVIIREGLSDRVITPGVTTTDDVVWWYRERIRALRLTTWFHPSVSVQRKETAARENDFSSRPEGTTIHRGDLLHVDFGITYLRLNTDTQQHAYVLKPGETEAPAGLRSAMEIGNRLQDLLTGEFEAGRSGNEILAATLAAAETAGIRATIYTHPIGYHGHGAGPTIGLWDQQGGVPGRGDYPLYAGTAHSIELNAAVPVAEWDDQDVRIMLEEDAFFDGQSVRYIDGRQTRLYLIR